jgi:hypothetical protein
MFLKTFFLPFLFLSLQAQAASYECDINANTQLDGNATSTLSINEESGSQMNLLGFKFQVRFVKVDKDGDVLDALGLWINDASSFIPLNSPWAYLSLPYSNGDSASILCELQ